VLGVVTSLDRDYPIITENITAPARPSMSGCPQGRRSWGRSSTTDRVAVDRHRAPGSRGVMARAIDARHILYLNLNGQPKAIELGGRSRSILKDRDYTGGFELGPYEPDFVEDRVGPPSVFGCASWLGTLTASEFRGLG